MHRAGACEAVTYRLGDQWVIKLSEKNIWDASDLALVRDAFRNLKPNLKHVAVDISDVMHLPPGFFGLLMDRSDLGWKVSLLNPTAAVTLFQWFQKYFQPDGEQRWLLSAT